MRNREMFFDLDCSLAAVLIALLPVPFEFCDKEVFSSWLLDRSVMEMLPKHGKQRISSICKRGESDAEIQCRNRIFSTALPYISFVLHKSFRFVVQSEIMERSILCLLIACASETLRFSCEHAARLKNAFRPCAT